jgi:hypothetical protein
VILVLSSGVEFLRTVTKKKHDPGKTLPNIEGARQRHISRFKLFFNKKKTARWATAAPPSYKQQGFKETKPVDDITTRKLSVLDSHLLPASLFMQNRPLV